MPHVNNYEQFQAFVNQEEFKWFIEQLRAKADEYRTIADLPGTSDSDRLWYNAKARGIEEAIKAPNDWLKS